MNMNKLIKQTCVIICIMLCILMSVSCGNKEKVKEEGSIDIYYSDKEQTKLVTMSYKPKKEIAMDVVQEVIDKMNMAPDKIDCIVAKPDLVKIVKWSLNDKILSIDFDANYLEMDKVTELLCRSSIVLTLTQLQDVDYVSFTINDQPLMDSLNNPVTTMKASDFVDNSGSNINSYEATKVVLYFANKDGNKLVAVNYSGLYAQNTSMEKFIIDRIIKGPTDNGLYRTVPSDLKLISVTTRDGICYVNFDDTFLEDYTNVKPQVELYSIVNSLSELTYINKVQISINGDTNKKFRDYETLKYSLIRNLDIISE